MLSFRVKENVFQASHMNCISIHVKQVKTWYFEYDIFLLPNPFSLLKSEQCLILKISCMLFSVVPPAGILNI